MANATFAARPGSTFVNFEYAEGRILGHKKDGITLRTDVVGEAGLAMFKSYKLRMRGRAIHDLGVADAVLTSDV